VCTGCPVASRTHLHYYKSVAVTLRCGPLSPPPASQDAGASDAAAYDRALELWGLSGPQAGTARLIEGMELSATGSGPGVGGRLSVHHLTIIPMFKVGCGRVHDGWVARLLSLCRLRRVEQAQDGQLVVSLAQLPQMTVW
jgi:hypothetical protein